MHRESENNVGQLCSHLRGDKDKGLQLRPPELLGSTPLMTIRPNHKALINQVGKVLRPCSLMLNKTVSAIYCRSLNNFYGHFNSSK